MLELNKIYLGDCLELSKEIESGIVDLILTDLPYGTIKGLGGELEKYKRLSKSEWDTTIDPKKIFTISNRILRKNGRMVLFSQEPYTTQLINETIQNVPFNYRMIWEKDHFANCLLSKKAPVSYYEDVLIFSKKYDEDGIHPLRLYFKSVMNFIGLNLKQINTKLGHRRAEHTFYINSTQYGLCTENTYNELIKVFRIDEMNGFKTYDELKKIDLPAIFNLWDGKKYKSNILKYKKDYDGFHPTQKPILLLEDIIKTFSNEGDIVIDLTMGSGSTAVACINTQRNYIGFELDEEYHRIANERIHNLIK